VLTQNDLFPSFVRYNKKGRFQPLVQRFRLKAQKRAFWQLCEVERPVEKGLASQTANQDGGDGKHKENGTKYNSDSEESLFDAAASSEETAGIATGQAT
jgi:hypothetical protein